jgi:hypothetical protein
MSSCGPADRGRSRDERAINPRAALRLEDLYDASAAQTSTEFPLRL